MALIAPSLLSANFLHLESDCRMLNESQADWYHLDVMDGRFVPNISFGPMLIDFFRKATTKYCDVHLMIEEPERYVDAFHKAGADGITVHLEASRHLHRTLQQIRSLGIKAGVAINPHTPVDSLSDILIDADLVCIMSVNPGFGGQSFIESQLRKIEAIRKNIDKMGLDIRLQVDGGVDAATAPRVIEAGADVLVAGTATFKGGPDHYASNIAGLRGQ